MFFLKTVKFFTKNAVLANCFKENVTHTKEHKEKKEKKTEQKIEEKKEETQGNPPPPPPNINIKPPPLLANLLASQNLPNVLPQKQENYDKNKFENARTELKRRLEQKKAEDNFEECIHIREKIKVKYYKQLNFKYLQLF